MVGSPITFQTYSGKTTEGIIQKIKNDSLWVMGYNIQIVPTRFGVTMVDTTSVYVVKVHYRDIASIYLNKKGKRLPLLASKALTAGGFGYAGLNTINHVLDGDTKLYAQKDNYQRLVTATAIGVSGFILWKLFKKTNYSRKRHKIVYVKLS